MTQISRVCILHPPFLLTSSSISMGLTQKLQAKPTPSKLSLSLQSARPALIPSLTTLNSTLIPHPQPPRRPLSGLNRLATMDDIFDSSLNLEETHFKEGYDQGYTEGLAIGKEEARQVGLKTGFQVGEELGFYKGCIDIWASAIRVDPARFSNRAQSGIRRMETMLQEYPMMDPEDPHVQEIMDELRVKFKMVCSSLHVKIEYNGYPKSSAEANDIEF